MDQKSVGDWAANRTIKLVEVEDRVLLLVRGSLYMSWEAGDEGSARMGIVQRYGCEYGTQEELAGCFGLHVNTVRKYISDYAGGGMRALLSQRRGPKGRWKLTRRLRGKILTVILKEGVVGLEAIQSRLAELWGQEVSLSSIREVLNENGLL